MRELIEYLESRDLFVYHTKKKIEGKCHINNKGWAKLDDYHLDKFLIKIDNPFGFLFNVKSFHTDLYSDISCMPRYYHKYRRKREVYWEFMSRPSLIVREKYQCK